MSKPELLVAADFQPLLNLLAQFQESAQHPIQIKYLLNLCVVLLRKEPELMSTSDIISEGFCSNLWIKMTQLAYRNSSTNLATSRDNLSLLRLLIEYRKFESNAFIETIVENVLNNEIKRSDETARLLIAMFRTVNIDVLEKSKELRVGVINWLNPKFSAHTIIKVMASAGEISLNSTSELYALCTLTKVDHSSQPQSNIVAEANDDFSRSMQSLETNLQYRNLSKLIVVDIKSGANPNVAPKHCLVDTNNVKAVIVDSYHEELEKVLNPIEAVHSLQDKSDDFAKMVKSLATYIRVLQQFVNYESLDDEKYNKSFLTKRVLIKVEQINMAIEALIDARQDDKEVFDVAGHLLTVYNNEISPMVMQLTIGNQKNRSVIKWCAKNLERITPSSKSCSLIVINNENELDYERKTQLRCLLVLTHLSAHDNEDSVTAFQTIEDHEFDVNCQYDVHILFEILKVS